MGIVSNYDTGDGVTSSGFQDLFSRLVWIVDGPTKWKRYLSASLAEPNERSLFLSNVNWDNATRPSLFQLLHKVSLWTKWREMQVLVHSWKNPQPTSLQ